MYSFSWTKTADSTRAPLRAMMRRANKERASVQERTLFMHTELQVCPVQIKETDLRTRRTPARLAFADHMNRFIAGDRTPGSPE